MLKVLSSMKLFISFILTVILLMIAMLFMHNGNTIIINMTTDDNSILTPQIYFANEQEGFSETQSIKSFKHNKFGYYFHLPKLSKIQKLRLDPDNKINTIAIHEINIITHNWFKKNVYKLTLDKSAPAYEITDFEKINHTLHFKTIGNDPQISIPFTIHKISKKHTLPFYELLLSVLIASVLFYLTYIYHVYSKNEILYAKIILFSLFLLFALYKVNYYKDHIKFSYPPDEIAHLSYIQYIHNHDTLLIPNFKEMVMFNDKHSGNYLSHPPLYYQMMDMVYDDSKSIVHNVDNFRELNILIFLTSFLLLLYLGFSAKMNIISDFVYLTIITAIPMYAYQGGAITNDNLAILGGLIFILGLKRALEEKYDNTTYIILALGIFLGYFAKLTVAILIFFAIILFLIYTYVSKNKFSISKLQFMLLILIAIPIFSYQYYILNHFHAMVPTFDHTHPEEYLKSGFFVPEEYRSHLSKLEWLDRMKKYVIEGWFNIHSHHSLVKENILGYAGLLLLHVFAVIALFFKCDKNLKRYCILGKIGLISLILLMIIQYIFSYKSHLHSGYMGGLQPRYLLPFMFSFAIMTSIFVERFKNIFILNVFIILVCIHALYSDFFYFLNYYA